MSYPKILIVGAGIAGLSAAVKLTENGFDTTVLEARNRCGGRIWTDDSLGFICSKGASWIHGIEGNPIVPIISELNLDTSLITKSVAFDRDGQEIPSADVHKFDIEFAHLLTQAKQFAQSLTVDVSLYDALSPFIKKKSMTLQEQDLFKKKLSFFENYMGAGYRFLSALHWDIEESLPGGNYFINSSYQPFIDSMSKKCKIQLSSVVKEITQRTQNIEITTQEKTLLADAVIVTVPLGVLKKNAIKFEPQLPQYKLRAINRLGMGLLNIIVLKFPRVFWNEDYHGMYLSVDGLFFLNMYSFNKQPLLINYIGGERSKDLECLSDEEILSQILGCLRKHFGSTIPDPESYFITRWGQDPFSFGSYSYVGVGACGEDYDHIARPISNRIFFAGEATERKFLATTHGAYLSGIRAAQKLKNLYKMSS